MAGIVSLTDSDEEGMSGVMYYDEEWKTYFYKKLKIKMKQKSNGIF
jgi:hypothetical protein